MITSVQFFSCSVAQFTVHLVGAGLLDQDDADVYDIVGNVRMLLCVYCCTLFPRVVRKPSARHARCRAARSACHILRARLLEVQNVPHLRSNL